VAVNPHTNKVYVAKFSSPTISVIDGATNTISATITVGAYPNGVVVNPSTNTIYVANSGAGTVSVINGSTNTVSATIPIGVNPFGIAVNPSTNRAYAANDNPGIVYVISDDHMPILIHSTSQNPFDVIIQFFKNLFHWK
jgi:YVTN family beta-propeller protein